MAGTLALEISHSASFSALGIAIVRPFLDLFFFYTFPVIPELLVSAPDSRFSTKGLYRMSSCQCFQMTSTGRPFLFHAHNRISLHHLSDSLFQTHLHTYTFFISFHSIWGMSQARENMFINKMDVLSLGLQQWLLNLEENSLSLVMVHAARLAC